MRRQKADHLCLTIHPALRLMTVSFRQSGKVSVCPSAVGMRKLESVARIRFSIS